MRLAIYSCGQRSLQISTGKECSDEWTTWLTSGLEEDGGQEIWDGSMKLDMWIGGKV